MGTYALIPHPETPSRAVHSVLVETELVGDCLWLRYHAEAELNALSLPDPVEPGRADGLWRTTCFEAFLSESGEIGYTEFNFSPSSQWAAYGFSNYREGMQDLDFTGGPDIGLDAGESHFALEVMVRVPLDLTSGNFKLALSAVFEETDGTKSYWALAHPPGKPDFHHPACFVAELPAPDGP